MINNKAWCLKANERSSRLDGTDEDRWWRAVYTEYEEDQANAVLRITHRFHKNK
jgi:hypothetical protein